MKIIGKTQLEKDVYSKHVFEVVTTERSKSYDKYPSCHTSTSNSNNNKEDIRSLPARLSPHPSPGRQ